MKKLTFLPVLLGLLLFGALSGSALAGPSAALLATCVHTGTLDDGNPQWTGACVSAPTATATATSSPTATASATATATDTATSTATATATNTATVAPTNTATATAVPPTATAAPTSAIQLVPWHAPGSHLDPISHLPLGIHEHGAPPPQWVLDSGHQPFIQTRESHPGYKGVFVPSDQGGRGVQSYLITHILTTAAAASHGDHDYQLWVRTPGTGAVSYWQGLLDFGSPPITRTVDTGERPIILGERTPTDGCNTWYERPGHLVFDMGWTICGRYQNFAGVVLGGIGTYRSADWQIYVSRFSQFPGAEPGLAAFCSDDGFGHCRLAFLSTGTQYPDAGVVPVN